MADVRVQVQVGDMAGKEDGDFRAKDNSRQSEEEDSKFLSTAGRAR